MGVHRESVSSQVEIESGYASASSSTGVLPRIVFTKEHLKFINGNLNNLSPLEILRWCRITFPNLYQTTAFGLSGLVTLDMLSKLQAESPSAPSIDTIFLDTLYHFEETHRLIEKTKKRYPNIILHIYKPEGVSTASEFEAKHGEELWKTDDKLYDYIVKVEPAERAYSDLAVAAVLTGRRRGQGARRKELDIVEVTDGGLIKINPLAGWSLQQVEEYIKENNVPYNELRDRGYKSVGDWHSTVPVADGEDERAGRWKGQNKTECGLHLKKDEVLTGHKHFKKSAFLQLMYETEQKRQQEELAAAISQAQSAEERVAVAAQ